MNRLHYYFAHPEVFWLLPALALAWLAVLWSWRQKRRAVRLLGQTSAVMKLLQTSPRVRRLSSLCVFLGLLLLLVAAAGPRWGWDVPRDTVREHDVVIVLDVSRSMLAEQPSRLERALRALNDLADRLQEQGGQRLALIVFAARPYLMFPLTRDYDHFRVALAEIKADDLPADIYARDDDKSGTRIGAALTLAAETFDPESRAPRAALLLSDGDDPLPNDEEWSQGVHAARAANVVVHTVGIGDPNQESGIIIKEVKTARNKTKARVEEGPLQFEGKDVKTKLEEKVLQDIALATGGVYLAAQTKVFPLGSRLPEVLAHQAANAAVSSPATVPVLQPRQSWFLWPALLLLSATLLLRERRPTPARNVGTPTRSVSECPKVDTPTRSASELAYTPNRVAVPRFGLTTFRACVSVALAMAALLQIAAFTPEDDWIRQGNAAVDRGELEAALTLYEKAEATTSDPGLVAFNKAAVLYRLKRYREAELHYLRCLEDRQAPRARQDQALFNLGNCLLHLTDDKNIATLDRAIDAFSTCLTQPDVSPQLAADAQYNLELARWLRFQAAPPPNKPPSQEDGGDPHRTNKKQDEKKKNRPADNSGTKPGEGDEGKEPDGTDKSADPKADQTLAQKFSRSGQLHNLPSTEEPTRVAPEDIAAHLEEVLRRIREQRREQAGRRPAAGPRVKDW